MIYGIRIGLFVAAVVAASPAAFAQDQTARALTIPRTSHPPEIDNFIGGEIRDAGVRVSDFRQREPGDGIPSSRTTEAYLSYDDQNLYVVFVCHEDRDKIRGRMSNREDIGEDDAVTVYLDTFRDGQRAYYFSVNPLGIQSDGVLTDGSGDGRFDALWRSEGRIFSDRYVALFAIPFRSLRFSNADRQTWGIALERSIRWNNESSFWPSITRRQTSLVQQMATADGLHDISPGRNIQLIPYAAYANARVLDIGSSQYQTHADSRAGLDAKLVIRNRLTLDMTVNPDFSQVETDDLQVTVNRRFEVFFPEKRPFFLENIDYFDTPLQLLFTRRIVNPEFGVRLTGKIGRWNVGLFGSDDRAPGKQVDAESPLHGDRALIGAMRIQREFGQDSNIGILAANRRFGSSESWTYAADAKLRLSPTWYLRGQMAYSNDASYDDSFELDSETGQGYFADLSRYGRNFSYTLSYQDLSPGFRAPLGFVRRVDTRTVTQYAGYTFRPQEGKNLSFGPSVYFGINWDHAGRLQDRYSSIDYRMDFTGPAGFNVTRYDAYENYADRGFRYHTMSASFYANWIKRFTFYGDLGAGTGVNYSPPEGVDPFIGKVRNFSFGFAWRPSEQLRVEQYYYYSSLRAPDGPAVFVNDLTRAKINFQFTKALSLRGIVDYYFLADSSRYKQLTGDFLLTYLLNPGTALYVGYNGRFENLAANPAAPAGLVRLGDPTHPTSRQFFVKLSYLLRY